MHGSALTSFVHLNPCFVVADEGRLFPLWRLARLLDTYHVFHECGNVAHTETSVDSLEMREFSDEEVDTVNGSSEGSACDQGLDAVGNNVGQIDASTQNLPDIDTGDSHGGVVQDLIAEPNLEQFNAGRGGNEKRHHQRASRDRLRSTDEGNHENTDPKQTVMAPSYQASDTDHSREERESESNVSQLGGSFPSSRRTSAASEDRCQRCRSVSSESVCYFAKPPTDEDFRTARLCVACRPTYPKFLMDLSVSHEHLQTPASRPFATLGRTSEGSADIPVVGENSSCDAVTGSSSSHSDAELLQTEHQPRELSNNVGEDEDNVAGETTAMSVSSDVTTLQAEQESPSAQFSATSSIPMSSQDPTESFVIGDQVSTAPYFDLAEAHNRELSGEDDHLPNGQRRNKNVVDVNKLFGEKPWRKS